MEGKAIVAAVLSTLLLPLLLSQPPRAIADVHLSIAALADHLSIEACSRFLDLLSRRNMILLCNAILLIVLRDAGVLSCRAAARHNADGDGVSSRSVVASAASPPVAARAASSLRRARATRKSDIVVWRPSKVAVAKALDVDESRGDDRPQRHEPATAPWAQPPEAEEKQSYDGLDDSVPDGRVSAGAIVLVEESKISSPVSDSDHHSAAADMNGQDDDTEALDQCDGDDHDDVDDMNRRFEEFIANTKRKMQLESLQLQLVMKA